MLDRFWSKISVDAKTGCWLWTGHVNKRWGYGQFWDGRRVVGAHSFSFAAFKGKPAAGIEPDHLCRIRRCVNPAHLEGVTRRVNLLRGDTIPARKAAQTMCGRGHPLAGANLIIAKNGTRQCRACKKATYRTWVENNRERRRKLDRDHYRRKKRG
ncbi:MAG: HNH endonuclease [Patescibacteria group bacterium]|nr:HNH endonuclease [Patescibacteria group bacterium]